MRMHAILRKTLNYPKFLFICETLKCKTCKGMAGMGNFDMPSFCSSCEDCMDCSDAESLICPSLDYPKEKQRLKTLLTRT